MSSRWPRCVPASGPAGRSLREGLMCNQPASLRLHSRVLTVVVKLWKLYRDSERSSDLDRLSRFCFPGSLHGLPTNPIRLLCLHTGLVHTLPVFSVVVILSLEADRVHKSWPLTPHATLNKILRQPPEIRPVCSTFAVCVCVCVQSRWWLSQSKHSGRSGR